MKSQIKYYKYYEKIMKTGLDTQVTDTLEYRRFSEVYPHIAESIVLNRNLEQLKSQLKSKEYEDAKFRIKRQITLTKSKLQKNSLNKRLHGSNKQEKLFRKHLKRKNPKKRLLWVRKKLQRKSSSTGSLSLKLRRSLHRKLPPTLFNLREHDVSEKGQVLKEWLHEKSDDLAKVLD